MKDWIKNYKKSTKKLNTKNIKNFFEALYRIYWLREEKYVVEQVMWRESKIKEVCRNLGYCEKCFCEFPEKLYETEACDGKCYPKWMNEEEWNKFKENGYNK